MIYYLAICLVQFIIVLGVNNAYDRRGPYRSLYNRETIGTSACTSIVAAMLPVLGLLIAFFMSGFAEHGFSLNFTINRKVDK